jgi:NAD(P)-dependent dehydrogenase (short-subunit alcohol dehydrogenase family)
MDFKNKIVLVSGGTKGIGRSICLEFLKQGATVLAIYSSDETAVSEMKKLAPKNLFFYKGSIADILFLKKMFTEIKSKFGGLDVLVNNAGINRDGLFFDMQKDAWHDVMEVNVKGTFLMSLLASECLKNTNFANLKIFEKFKKQKKAYIVNISSIAGVYGNVGQANYSTSKGAIIGMTRLFAKKYFDLNINVNCLIPGLIETEMIQSMPKEKVEQMASIVTMKRLGKPEEIAKTVLFLSSEDSSYMTGTSVFVDGGFLK